MKKLFIILLALSVSLGMFAFDPPVNLAVDADNLFTWDAPNAVPGFNDGFETYDDFVLEFAPWTQFDGDGSNTYSINGFTFPNQNYVGSYIIFNPSTVTPPLTDVTPHSGDKMAACFAATSLLNDDWMIAPQTNIVDGDEVSFFAKSYTDQYGLERFNVAVSTTGTAPADFTVISGATYIEAPTDWTEYNFDLSSYAGQDVYVAIQCVTADAFIFFVDDFHIGAPADVAYASVPSMNGNAGREISDYIPGKIVSTSTSLRELESYNVYLDSVMVGNTTDTEWLFENLVYNQTYTAGVQAVYDDGESEIVTIDFTSIVTNAGNIIVTATALEGNYPNPFNPITNIAYSVSTPGRVSIEVYNVKGEKVITLVDKVVSAGEDHIVTWNGNDDSGKSVTSGIYFYKMKADDYTATKKMIMMK